MALRRVRRWAGSKETTAARSWKYSAASAGAGPCETSRIGSSRRPAVILSPHDILRTPGQVRIVSAQDFRRNGHRLTGTNWPADVIHASFEFRQRHRTFGDAEGRRPGA